VVFSLFPLTDLDEVCSANYNQFYGLTHDARFTGASSILTLDGGLVSGTKPSVGSRDRPRGLGTSKNCVRRRGYQMLNSFAAKSWDKWQDGNLVSVDPMNAILLIQIQIFI